jgi:D-alanyl-D-alanine carboxypeptidase (penicillin-binding protein 5/6)
MKKKRILSLFLLLCLLSTLFIPLALAEEPEEGEAPEEPFEAAQPSATPAPAGEKLEGPELSAKAVYLVDLDSGYPLYSLDSGYPRSPASLTKVMTVLLALEAVDRGEASLDDVVTAGLDCQNGMSDDSSSVYIVAGEQMTLRDLLYCAAVSSGNDACNVIASYLGGGIPNFVERMNARAAELGCTTTRFVDPNGLSNDNITCAYDLYLITRAAMGYPAFMEICDTTAYTVSATNLNPARELKNSNALISAEGIYGPGYLYEGAHGIKTGYTRAAGYCLISTAERDGMRLLAIVMGCDGPYLSDITERKNFSDTALLYDWAFANFTPRTILSEDTVLDYVDVNLAEGDARVGLKPQRSVNFPLPNNVEPGKEDVRITLYDQELSAPIEAGTVLGEAHVFYDGREFASVRVVASGSVELNRWEYFKQRIRAFLSQTEVLIVIIAIAVLLAAYLALVTRYRILRRKHLKQRKLAEQRRKELARQRAEEAARAEEKGTPFDKDLF